MLEALLQRGQWYVACNCIWILCRLIDTTGIQNLTIFFLVGKRAVKWQLCLSGNIVICISWSLLSLLSATEDHISKTAKVLILQDTDYQSFGNRRHITDRSLLVKRPWPVSAADVIKSFLYKILFWSIVWFVWKSAFSFLREKKNINSSWRHWPSGLQHHEAVHTEVKIQTRK